MKSYTEFAAFYDCLTQNVDYKKLAKYYDGLIKKYGNNEKIVLDLACGTGTLSVLLAKLGYDVVATDASEQMLSQAMLKVESFGNPIFLNQSMQELDLFGTIDAAVCCLDSINHIDKADDIKKAFEKVSLFMNKGGVFVFDVNTLHKHKNILAGNTFVYDTESVYCVWQNSYSDMDSSVEISLDFFEQNENGSFERSCENFKEYYYSDEFLTKTLENCGFSVLKRYDGFTENPIKDDTERAVYVCRKD